MPDAHEHQWKTMFHLDSCHGFSWGYECPCGAQRTIAAERDPSDPYFSVWADDECERCMLILNGAEREHSDVITMPGGEATDGS
jgi:hypothetical protein